MTSTTSPTFASRTGLTLPVQESGAGRPALVLHGGGGPGTVAGLAAHLAATHHTLLPTHPGWNGTARPKWLADVSGLAGLYLELIEAEGLRDIVLVGSSLGGWTAAEMAARDTEGLIGALVVLDTVGIVVEDHPMVDFFGLDARGVAEHSFHDAERFYVDPASLSDAERAGRAGNMAALRALAGEPYMHDPELPAKLAAVKVPSQVLWGESDRIATPEYGRAFAALIPGARFGILERAGHLPQLEQPAATFAAIDGFLEDVWSGTFR
jgi:pimeloyl-ACP methyl ester carboxylesterase